MLTHPRLHRGKSGLKAATTLVAALMFALLIAACGGSDDGDGGSGGGDGGGDLPSVTIASAASTPIFEQPYLAQALDYWKDAGVDVEIQDNTGSNTLNYVASGQADLGMISAAAPLLLAQQGKDSKIVYSPQGGPSAGMLVGGKDVTSIDDLKGQRIGTLAKGSSTYGFAQVYDDKFGLDATLVPLTTNAAVIGALKSGQVAGATGPYDSFAALVDSGEANILVDTRNKAERVKALGPDYPEGAVFGLADNLEAKRESIVAVIAGLDKALDYVRSNPPEDVAKLLREDDSFQSIPEQDLATYVDSASNYVGMNDGAIPEDVWDYALSQYATWGLDGFDPEDPVYDYDKRVDMSYLEEAQKQK